MWRFLEKYFTFSKGEKNAILALLFLSIAVCIIPRVYLYFKPVEHVDNSKYQAEIDSFMNEYNQKKQLASVGGGDSIRKAPIIFSKSKTDSSIQYFTFDPNKIGVAEWMKLGFSEKQAESIEKYKAKGGKFYKPEDLKRLYVMSEEAYGRLLPYVKIVKEARKIEYFEFDPNTIGVEEWMKLGFSEKQALSIEKYKAKGGKFRKPEDFKKMYVVSEENYQRLVPYIRIGTVSK